MRWTTGVPGVAPARRLILGISRSFVGRLAVARATACARLCASPTFFRRSLSDLAASASDLTSEEVFVLGAVAAFIAS